MINEKYIRVLYVDMESGKIRVEQREDLLAYLGGVGIASRLLMENMKPHLAPTNPEQPIIFAIGAGTYVFPVLSKTVAKSGSDTASNNRTPSIINATITGPISKTSVKKIIINEAKNVTTMFWPKPDMPNNIPSFTLISELGSFGRKICLIFCLIVFIKTILTQLDSFVLY